MNKTHENKTQTQNAVTLWHFVLFFLFFWGVKIVTLIDLVLFSNSFKGWFGGTCDQSKTRRFISSMVGSSSTSCHEAKHFFAMILNPTIRVSHIVYFPLLYSYYQVSIVSLTFQVFIFAILLSLASDRLAC